MSYVKRSLRTNEKILGRAKVHWSVMLSAVTTWILGLILIYVIFIFADSLELDGGADGVAKWGAAGVGGLVGLMITAKFLSRALAIISTEYAVTDSRLIQKHGFFRRQAAEMQLAKIESIDIKQGIRDRIFGAGKVVATGTGGSLRPAFGIGSPMRYKKQIEEAIELRTQSK